MYQFFVNIQKKDSAINIRYHTGSAADMEKGADARTLSAEIYENCGNIWIVEEYLISFWNKTL